MSEILVISFLSYMVINVITPLLLGKFAYAIFSMSSGEMVTLAVPRRSRVTARLVLLPSRTTWPSSPVS